MKYFVISKYSCPVMEKCLTQYLHGYVNEWQTDTIDSIKNNTVSYADMIWRTQDGDISDVRNVYASKSTFFDALFRNTSMRKNIESDGGINIYKVDGFMTKSYVFNMVRVFCHTGIVEFEKGESIVKTLDRYEAFHFYDLQGGIRVLHQKIMDQLNPSNAIQALEFASNSAIHTEQLLESIENFISVYAFVIFKHKSFPNANICCIPAIIRICKRDDLNITDIDLLRCIFRLCEKRKRHDKGFVQFSNSLEILKHDFGGEGSMWDSIRIDSISITDFMSFIHENGECFSSDATVGILKRIYSLNEESSNISLTKKRKKFKPISFYPRELNINGLSSPQVDITYWDDNRVSVFFIVDYGSENKTILPPTPFRDYLFHGTLDHSDKNIHMHCTIHRNPKHKIDGIVGNLDNKVKVTISIVNFKHDRWKKTTTSVCMNSGVDFTVNNILSSNTIEGSKKTECISEYSGGYLFDIEKYPDYVEGSWMMIFFSIEI